MLRYAEQWNEKIVWFFKDTCICSTVNETLPLVMSTSTETYDCLGCYAWAAGMRWMKGTEPFIIRLEQHARR